MGFQRFRFEQSSRSTTASNNLYPCLEFSIYFAFEFSFELVDLDSQLAKVLLRPHILISPTT
jgi:hypothetical protein